MKIILHKSLLDDTIPFNYLNVDCKYETRQLPVCLYNFDKYTKHNYYDRHNNLFYDNYYYFDTFTIDYDKTGSYESGKMVVLPDYFNHIMYYNKDRNSFNFILDYTLDNNKQTFDSDDIDDIIAFIHLIKDTDTNFIFTLHIEL